MTLNKYQELMERLTVSGELRERTLRAVEQGVQRESRPKLLRLLPLAAVAALMLALLPLGTTLLRPMGSANPEQTAGVTATQYEDAGEEQGEDAAAGGAVEEKAAAADAQGPAEETEEAVLAPEQVESLEALSALTGLELRELSNLPFVPENVTYTAYGDLAEVFYQGAGRRLYWRISAGSADNSGDFNDYPRVRQLTLSGRSVTVKGEGEEISLALWSEGEQSCSIAAEPALTMEELEAIGLGG